MLQKLKFWKLQQFKIELFNSQHLKGTHIIYLS